MLLPGWWEGAAGFWASDVMMTMMVAACLCVFGCGSVGWGSNGAGIFSQQGNERYCADRRRAKTTKASKQWGGKRDDEEEEKLISSPELAFFGFSPHAGIGIYRHTHFQPHNHSRQVEEDIISPSHAVAKSFWSW